MFPVMICRARAVSSIYILVVQLTKMPPPLRSSFLPPTLPPNSPANSPTMPARLDGNVSPARRNAFLRPKSDATNATRDATEAKGEGPTLAAGMATSGAGIGGGEITAGCGRGEASREAREAALKSHRGGVATIPYHAIFSTILVTTSNKQK